MLSIEQTNPNQRLVPIAELGSGEIFHCEDDDDDLCIVIGSTTGLNGFWDQAGEFADGVLCYSFMSCGLFWLNTSLGNLVERLDATLTVHGPEVD